MRGRRAIGRLLAGVLLSTAFAVLPLRAVPASALGAASLDPLLQQALSTAGSLDSLTLVAVADRQPTALDLLALRATGAKAMPYQRLPMIALSATPSQIAALATLPHVRSLWL